MNHIITTTPYIDAAIIRAEDTPVTIVIFAKLKDVVPIRVVQDVSEKKNLKIQVVYSETKEENLLWLGSLLSGKKDEDEFLILGDTIALSDHIKKVYGIKTEKIKKERSAGTTKSKRQTKTKNEENASVKTSEKDLVEKNDTSNKRLPQTSFSDKTEKQEFTPSRKKEMRSESEMSVKPDEKAIEVPTSQSQQEILNVFIKAMAVRSSDLAGYEGSDAELAKEIAGVVKKQAVWTKDDLGTALENEFGVNSEVILKWIKPNIKKLQELAAQM